MKFLNIPEFRPCYILGRGRNNSRIKALFHCWATLDYGMYGANRVKTAAIVEFEDGSLALIHPESIKFVSGVFNEYTWCEEGKEDKD